MDPTTYQQWWPLHLRFARGETLSPSEQSAYDKVRRELEQSEHIAETTSARLAREELLAVEEEYQKLENQRQRLDVEIATLESQLSETTRQCLGVED